MFLALQAVKKIFHIIHFYPACNIYKLDMQLTMRRLRKLIQMHTVINTSYLSICLSWIPYYIINLSLHTDFAFRTYLCDSWCRYIQEYICNKIRSSHQYICPSVHKGCSHTRFCLEHNIIKCVRNSNSNMALQSHDIVIVPRCKIIFWFSLLRRNI